MRPGVGPNVSFVTRIPALMFQVTEELWEPIKGYGETTSRGRRRHTRHVEFQEGGVRYMRMRFHLQGSRRKALAHVEAEESPETGRMEFRQLLVEVTEPPYKIFALVDHREAKAEPPTGKLLLQE